MIMLFAQAAFTQAHRTEAQQIRIIDKSWKALKGNLDKTAAYTLFKTHYTEELREMAVNIDFGAPDGTANLAAVQQGARIAELEQQLSNLANHTGDLASAFQASQSDDRSAIPPTIDTARRSAPTDSFLQGIIDNNAALSAQVATLTNTINNGTTSRRTDTPGRGRGRGTPAWGSRTDSQVYKQYNEFCSSCGVNLSHTGRDCNTKKPNHNDAATFENPMGGNTRKNYKWMKWRDPASGKTVDHCSAI